MQGQAVRMCAHLPQRAQLRRRPHWRRHGQRSHRCLLHLRLQRSLPHRRI
jgi:hypothetical protein